LRPAGASRHGLGAIQVWGDDRLGLLRPGDAGAVLGLLPALGLEGDDAVTESLDCGFELALAEGGEPEAEEPRRSNGCEDDGEEIRD
jgi:hypothetical protein